MATENLLESGLYYEGGPPADVADRINASFPNYLQKPIHKRIVVDIANDDRSVAWVFSRLFSPSKGPCLPERRWKDFVESVSASTRASMALVSSYWCGVRPAGITLVRFFHGAFTIGHRTHPPDANHRRRREPIDNRWED
jgi:hypothetical protein